MLELARTSPGNDLTLEMQNMVKTVSFLNSKHADDDQRRAVITTFVTVSVTVAVTVSVTFSVTVRKPLMLRGVMVMPCCVDAGDGIVGGVTAAAKSVVVAAGTCAWYAFGEDGVGMARE
jgi:hypothetical protein